MKESSTRSFLKAISYRVVASLVTAGLVYMVTGQTALALGMGLLDSLVKVGVFFFHERLWAWIPIGRKAHPLAGINVNGTLSAEHHALIERHLADLGYSDKVQTTAKPEAKPGRDGNSALAFTVPIHG